MKILYACDFCDVYFTKKSKCKTHENECAMNPKNKKCGSCAWFDEKSVCTFNFENGEAEVLKDSTCGNWIEKENRDD